MKCPHSLAALAAGLVLLVALFAGVKYAESVESQAVHALTVAEIGNPQIDFTGIAIQKMAFQQPDLLPIYGSSEVILEYDPYSESRIFRNYPTGFRPFEVAEQGATSLISAQALSGIGTGLRGKKVVLSFTPGIFFVPTITEDIYAGLYSQLHGNELIFSPDLSLDLKNAAARRMQKYPKSLETDPVLHFAVDRLAEGSPLSQGFYYLSFPLGWLHTRVLELQDHWESVNFIWSQPELEANVKHQPRTIDWKALEAQALAEQIPHSNNNPYGIDNELWNTQWRDSTQLAGPGALNHMYTVSLARSTEWTDIEILLRTLKELGAEPLIMCRPMKGIYEDAIGASAQVRNAFYDKLEAVGQRYGVPVIDYRDHDMDKYFSIDPSAHTSRTGWVHVDQALDTFYNQEK